MPSKEVVASIKRRLLTIADIDDGEVSPTSKAVPIPVIEHVEYAALKLIDYGFKCPSLFTYDGECSGIQAEWREKDDNNNTWFFTIEWRGDGVCEVYGHNLNTYDEREISCRWDDRDYLDKVIQYIEAILTVDDLLQYTEGILMCKSGLSDQ